MKRALALALLLACSGAQDAEPDPEGTEGAEAPGWTGALDEDAFAALHELSAEETPPLRGRTIGLPHSEGYLSLPEGDGPHPGVILIHEWWGLNDHIRHWADRLAEAGYAAFAVDLYGGETAEAPPEAMALMQAVDEGVAVATLREADAFLANHEWVQAERRAVIGWCFGGGMALTAAMNVDGLDAVVMYYGRTIADVDRLARIEAPLLGIFADRDTAITPESVDAFDTALDEAEVTHTIHRYDADHAFANPSSARYDHDNATDAWEKVQAFLAEHLR